MQKQIKAVKQDKTSLVSRQSQGPSIPSQDL